MYMYMYYLVLSVISFKNQNISLLPLIHCYSLFSAKKTLKEIRQLYYRLKDDVFASPRFGLSYNTKALERLLIDIFGTEMTLEHDRENMPKSAIRSSI